ncbi:tetratricopeptide repeat protein [Variovorax ginsengisoli]|uniref:Tetratricopeptide (TPR) repeat protein n=1 Tax=Variovorax ginsengisoli TaxID=363844 RepID=A0ABT9S7L7_9BURK|nr:hypothetical protein [Variovorax ginsengisoli]MDP9900341.1 tetratricopeptide (TPR) repeat protein [Variovorax ginsengisoli]
MTAAPPPLDATRAEAVLAEGQAVVERLLPLTGAGAGASLELQEHLASAWLSQIDALGALDRPDDVVAVADALCAHFEPRPRNPIDPVMEVAAPAAWPWIARAMCEKAMALGGSGHHDAALALLQDVQQRFGDAQRPALRQWVASAGLEEARLRASLGAVFARVDMVRHCQRLIERFGGDEAPAIRLVVARTRAWQARLLSRLDHDEDALAAYTSLHADLQSTPDPALQEQAADALHAKARLLQERGRTDEARVALQALIDSFADAQHSGVRQTLALAHMDQAYELQRIRLEGDGDMDGIDADARVIDACDALLHAHEHSTDTVVLRCVNQALRLKAGVLRERALERDADTDNDDHAMADALTEQQWARYADHPDAQVQQQVVLAMLDRLLALDDPRQTLSGCSRLLDRFASAQAERLQPPLARARRLQAWCLRVLGRTEEARAALIALDARHGASHDPSVQRQVIEGRIEHARLLRGTRDFAGALAVLDAIAPDLGADADADADLRKAVALAMDLRVDLWKDQAPPAHPQQSGKDETGAAIAVEVTPAELQRAEAVEALTRRFAADASPDIRAIVAHALYALAVDWREHLHFQRAIDTYADYLQRFAADTSASIETITASAYLNQAYVLMMLLDRDAEALPLYDALVARFAHATSAEMRDTLARAGASRLTCLNRLQRQGVAVSYGDHCEDLSLAQRDAIQATIERGRVLSVAGKEREAIACYDEVLGAHVESLHPELRRQCLDAMVRKAYSLSRLSQREAALAVNDEVIARYGDELSTSAEEDVALAMSNRAVQLDALGRREEELQTYDLIIARWRDSSVPYLRQRVASARYCKALTLSDTDLKTALAIYQHVMDTCLNAREAAIRLEGAKSAANRSFRLRSAGRYDEALACSQALLQACGEETDVAIAAQCVKVRIGMARTYGKTGQVARQAEMLQALLALPPTALTDAQRSELQAEYRLLAPVATPLGKAAHALGRWFGKRRQP